MRFQPIQSELRSSLTSIRQQENAAGMFKQTGFLGPSERWLIQKQGMTNARRYTVQEKKVEGTNIRRALGTSSEVNYILTVNDDNSSQIEQKQRNTHLQYFAAQLLHVQDH